MEKYYGNQFINPISIYDKYCNIKHLIHIFNYACAIFISALSLILLMKFKMEDHKGK